MTVTIPATDEHTQFTGVTPAHDDSAAGVSRFVVVLAVTGTILLALGAFWLSFTTLRDLAVLSGIPAGQAWIWPLIVDGVILEATISVVALRNSAKAARRFAWLLLAAGAGVSVAANITHAIVAADTRVPALIAALVASVPPLVLLAMTHLTVELTRNSAPATPQNQQPQSPSPRTDAMEDPELLPDQHSSNMIASEALKLPERESSASVAAPLAGAKSAASGSGQDARAQALVLHADGISKRQIATELGVHPTTVGRWLNAPTRRQDGEPDD